MGTEQMSVEQVYVLVDAVNRLASTNAHTREEGCNEEMAKFAEGADLHPVMLRIVEEGD